MVTVFRDTVTSPSVGVLSVIQAGAFWGAVVLPFTYLPLVVVGLDGLDKQLLFASLVSLNIILLVVGHRHRD